MLAQHPMDGGATDYVGFRQFSQALAILPAAEDGGSIENQCLPSDMSPLELGPPHAGAHMLDHRVAFEFSDGADDHDNRPTQWTDKEVFH